jgi:hypothetical protein
MEKSNDVRKINKLPKDSRLLYEQGKKRNMKVNFPDKGPIDNISRHCCAGSAEAHKAVSASCKAGI